VLGFIAERLNRIVVGCVVWFQLLENTFSDSFYQSSPTPSPLIKQICYLFWGNWQNGITRCCYWCFLCVGP